MHTSPSLAWFITSQYAISLFYAPRHPGNLYGAGLRDFLIGSVIVIEGRFFWGVFYPKHQSNTQGEKNKAINPSLACFFFLTVTEPWSTHNAYRAPAALTNQLISCTVLFSHFILSVYRLFYSFDLKTESTRKLNNFAFQWTKTLHQNNLKHIAFFFTFFKG